MQQSGDQPHGEPRPSHRLMGSVAGSFLFSGRGFVRRVYEGRLVAHPIPEQIIERARKEFGIRGTASLARRSFATTDFDAELEDRLSTLFAAMSMPVLFLQGRLDPGQHPEEYAGVATAVADGHLEFVGLGRDTHQPRTATVAPRSGCPSPSPGLRRSPRGVGVLRRAPWEGEPSKHRRSPPGKGWGLGGESDATGLGRGLLNSLPAAAILFRTPLVVSTAGRRASSEALAFSDGLACAPSSRCWRHEHGCGRGRGRRRRRLAQDPDDGRRDGRDRQCDRCDSTRRRSAPACWEDRRCHRGTSSHGR